VLYAFTGGADGAGPSQGPLIRDESGALYGTTSNGGHLGGNCVNTRGCGTVFKLTPPATPGGAWTETVLHSFTNTTDGGFPQSGLIMDATGALFGTTALGPGFAGQGTVFQLTPPAAGQTGWTHTVLHAFADASDGSYPIAGVTMDATGALYGTTEFGGHAIDCGTLYMLTPPAAGQTEWSETILHRFRRHNSPLDGCEPVAGVILHCGRLIGTTLRGGVNGRGVVYEYRFNP
jgi:uncharacterized repeat protein (TIGR03803 family)